MAEEMAALELLDARHEVEADAAGERLGKVLEERWEEGEVVGGGDCHCGGVRGARVEVVEVGVQGRWWDVVKVVMVRGVVGWRALMY